MTHEIEPHYKEGPIYCPNDLQEMESFDNGKNDHAYRCICGHVEKWDD